MPESGFTIDVDQNQYLPEGGREVSAIVTVTSAADAAGLSGPGPADGVGHRDGKHPGGHDRDRDPRFIGMGHLPALTPVNA